MKKVLGLLAVTLGFMSAASADNPLDVAEYLTRFHENPKAVMNDRLSKFDENGNILPEDPRVTLEERRRTREELAAHSTRLETRARIPDSEKLDDLLSGIRTERRLNEMERRGMVSSRLPYTPWSGSYWPTRSGGLGWRYADPSFPNTDFKSNHAYYTSRPSTDIDIAQMSPSEKYDLLLGDRDFNYTKANWKKGLSVVEDKPDVPTWYGICHGWAPAAYLADEPKKAVTVALADGRQLTFLPSDIKALASSLWADTDIDLVFLGRKCLKPNPPEDDMGRIVDPECFNTNPGSWHMALINRLSLGRESFVMDATYDTEVWNQPIVSYKYSYFNPQTFEVSNRLFGAIIPIEKFTLDKFKKYRAAETRHVVGIALDVTYGNEILPSTRTGPDRNSLKTVRYIYDLELDRAHQIIGGEWYSNKHPDFLWSPVSGFEPRSYGETTLGVNVRWKGRGPIPSELLKAAAISSPRSEPLAGIVNTLVELSK